MQGNILLSASVFFPAWMRHALCIQEYITPISRLQDCALFNMKWQVQQLAFGLCYCEMCETIQLVRGEEKKPTTTNSLKLVFTFVNTSWKPTLQHDVSVFSNSLFQQIIFFTTVERYTCSRFKQEKHWRMCCFMSVISFSVQHSSCSAHIRYITISHLFTACTQHCKKALNTSRIIFTHRTQQLTSH